MWTGTALLACVAALAAGSAFPKADDRHFQASSDYLHKQKLILQLFVRPQEQEIFPEFSEIEKNYHLEEHVDKYEDPAHVKEFVKFLKAGAHFPRDRTFSQFSENGLKELKHVFELFFYAKDFDTFIKTAVYLRQHINMGILYYAFVTALEARQDTRDFYFPPLYETYPYLFVDERVIEQALEAKIRGLQSGNHEKVVIHSNYSRYWDSELDPETSLYYFTEDVGLNTFNAEFDRRFPFWWESHKYQLSHDRKGELFLHYQRQLLARYYLERLSNNLGEIPYLSKDEPLPGYFPRLRYINGQEVTPRQPFTYVRDTEESLVNDIVYSTFNLWSAIDAGYIYDSNGTKLPLDYPHGVDILGKLAYFHGDSPNDNLYGTYLLELMHQLGHMSDPDANYDLAPSALMRPETALRDPLYYSIISKFFDDIYYRYIEKVPKYTYEDMAASELKIEDVHVDDLITYFEDFDINLMNVHNMAFTKEKRLDIYARLRRLNHRHFNYKVSVDSEKEMRAVVKVYLTPKYDSQHRLIPVNKRAFYAFEIDNFHIDVPAGKSTFERKCDESTVAVRDPPSFNEMWYKIKAALENNEAFNVDKFYRPYGFPQRLLLPKGLKSGLPVQFVVAIYPYDEAADTDSRAYNLNSFSLLGTSYDVKFPSRRPISFPIDRMFRSEYDVNVPNVFTKEVRIYQKTQEEINQVPDVHQ